MATWLQSRASESLGCRYPLVLAGMGGVSRWELVAAVSAAGGFGFLGMVREPVALLRAEVAQLRLRGHPNFGVNLIPAATAPPLLEAQVAACIELEVPAVCLFWDLDEALVRRLRDAGIRVAYQVGSADEAAAVEQAGAEIIIAQGVEAGGHVRGRQELVELLPQVLAATTVPVLAAGGIATGRDVALALALGAEGVMLGTMLIATREAFAHDYHKQRLLAAVAGDTVLTDSFHVNWPSGAAVRVLRSAVTEGGFGDPQTAESTVIGSEEGRPIRRFSTDSPLRTTTGQLGEMALYAGRGVSAVTGVVPAGERLTGLLSETRAILDLPGEAAELPERASPVCYAGEISAEYMGLLGRDELLERLVKLLELLRTASAAADGPDRGADAGQLVAMRWAVRLAGLIRGRGDEALLRTPRKLQPPRTDATAILAEIRSLLPLVADDCVREPLEAMLRDFGDAAGVGQAVP